MKSRLVKYAVAFVLCLAIVALLPFSVPMPVSAEMSVSEMQQEINRLQQESNNIKSEINRLKAQQNDKNAIKAALEKQISNLQQQIAVCNQQINQSNAEIAASEAEIAKKNEEIEINKQKFKKRIRAIYMSNTNSNVQILLGAENFADYLALSELTKDVSARDKQLINSIVDVVNEIEVEIQKNKDRIAAQNEIKKTLAAKQNEMEAQVKEVQGVISDLNSQSKDLAALQAQYKTEMNNYSIKIAQQSSGSNLNYDGSQFKWPCPGFYRITSGFGPRWGTHHSGIDIASAGIFNAPVVASADGVVYMAYNSCPHNYGKGGSCGCGGGYGNHAAIDHGSYQGSSYKTLYAHMTKIIVSKGQYVTKGQVIGYVGSTGWSTGWHLHYEVYKNNARVDPEKYVGANVK